MTLANPLRKVASKLMAAFGGDVTIRIVTPGAYNTSTGAIAESVADTAVRGVLEDVSVRTDNELVQAGDKRLIIAALDLGDYDYLLTEDSFALLYEDDTFIYQEVGNPFGTPDPTAEFPREIYFVDRKSAENRNVVEFELASAFDMVGVRAPKRQCITRCQWVYRSVECSYTGTNYFNVSDVAVGNASQDVCGKRVDSCKARFGQNAELPFGGYPGIGTYFA